MKWSWSKRTHDKSKATPEYESGFLNKKHYAHLSFLLSSNSCIIDIGNFVPFNQVLHQHYNYTKPNHSKLQLLPQKSTTELDSTNCLAHTGVAPAIFFTFFTIERLRRARLRSIRSVSHFISKQIINK